VGVCTFKELKSCQLCLINRDGLVPGWLEINTYLERHVVVACPVEVFVGPASKGWLRDDRIGSVVVEGELSLRLKEPWHLMYCTTVRAAMRYSSWLSQSISAFEFKIN